MSASGDGVSGVVHAWCLTWPVTEGVRTRPFRAALLHSRDADSSRAPASGSDRDTRAHRPAGTSAESRSRGVGPDLTVSTPNCAGSKLIGYQPGVDARVSEVEQPGRRCGPRRRRIRSRSRRHRFVQRLRGSLPELNAAGDPAVRLGSRARRSSADRPTDGAADARSDEVELRVRATNQFPRRVECARLPRRSRPAWERMCWHGIAVGPRRASTSRRVTAWAGWARDIASFVDTGRLVAPGAGDVRRGRHCPDRSTAEYGLNHLAGESGDRAFIRAAAGGRVQLAQRRGAEILRPRKPRKARCSRTWACRT